MKFTTIYEFIKSNVNLVIGGEENSYNDNPEEYVAKTKKSLFNSVIIEIETCWQPNENTIVAYDGKAITKQQFDKANQEGAIGYAINKIFREESKNWEIPTL